MKNLILYLLLLANVGAFGQKRIVIGGGGTTSGGTVKSVSGGGNLFSINNSTTTPTITFYNAPAHKFFGNNTGTSTTPNYFALTVPDLPTGIPNANLQNSYITINGTPVYLGSSVTVSGAGLSGTGYVKQSGGTSAYIVGIPNTDLQNSSIIINGTPVSLGGSITVTGGTGLSPSHPVSSGSSPSVADATGGILSSVSVTGTDLSMQLTFTIPSGQTVNGDVATITFASAWGATPKSGLTAASRFTIGSDVGVVNTSTTQLIVSGQSLTAGTYVYNIQTIQ